LVVAQTKHSVIGNAYSEEFPERTLHPCDSVLPGSGAPVMAEKLRISITHLTGHMTHNTPSSYFISLRGPLVLLVSDV
jgi:hypothetical protein